MSNGMPEPVQPRLAADDHDRRQFLKRMAAVGFAVPVVASFSMVSSTPAFAQTLCSGGVSDGAVGNQTNGSYSNCVVRPRPVTPP